MSHLPPSGVRRTAVSPHHFPRRPRTSPGHLAVALGLCLGVAACAGGPGTGSEERVAPVEVGLDVPIVEQYTETPPAESFSVEVGCSTDDPRTAYADLMWSAEPVELERQRLDVTVYKKGFEKGNFVALPLDRPDVGFQHARPEQKLEAQPYARALSLQVAELQRPERQGPVRLRVADLDAGLEYFWRLLTRTEEGWRPTETVRRSAPTCVADFHRVEG